MADLIPDLAHWQGPMERLQSLLDAGGAVLYVLAVLSLVTAALIVYKSIEFARLRIGRTGFVREALAAWRAGERGRALAVLGRRKGPAARFLERAMRAAAAEAAAAAADAGAETGARAAPAPPAGRRQALEEDLAREGAFVVASLGRGLRLLELIATLSPLLGLLGTVLGMIEAFQALEAAGNRVNPSLLSGGIWTALLTTAAGLIVAIPAAAGHHFLEGAVDRTARTLEAAANEVLRGGALAEPAPEPAAPRPAAAPAWRPEAAD